ELLAVAAPGMAEVVTPRRVRRVLLGDGPVGRILHLRGNGWTRAGSRCEIVEAGGVGPVVRDRSNAPVVEPNLTPRRVAVDVGTALPLAHEGEVGAVRLGVDDAIPGAGSVPDVHRAGRVITPRR